MEIIPAIDIIEGKCVRLSQGDFAQMKSYRDNPLEVAKEYENAGIRRLHLVDLDGARKKKVVNLPVLEKIASKTDLKVDFGGGVQSDEDIRSVFNAGAAQVTGGSIAVKNPTRFLDWIVRYGREKIILGADTREGKIAVSGWQETSEVTVQQLIENFLLKGIKYVICTDVSRDGLLKGPAVGLYKEILKEFPEIKLIASGGVSSVKDLERLQNETGVYGVIIGKAIYEGKVSLQDLKKFID